MQQGLDQFSKQLLHFDSPTHSKLTRSPAGDGMASVNPRSASATTSNPLQESILTQLRQLMATCMVLRLGDLLVYRVSTAKSRQTPKEFVLGKLTLFDDLICSFLPSQLCHWKLHAAHVTHFLANHSVLPNKFICLCRAPVFFVFTLFCSLAAHCFLSNKFNNWQNSSGTEAQETHRSENQRDSRLDCSLLVSHLHIARTLIVTRLQTD